MNKEQRQYILDNMTREQIKTLYILLTVGTMGNLKSYLDKVYDYEDGTNDDKDAVLEIVWDFVKSN